MKIAKLVITVFLVLLTLLSVEGLVWWSHPPEALQASASGGRFILGLSLIGCLGGLVRVWMRGPGTATR